MTLKMTSAQVVETSVNVISNSPSQDYTHPDDRTLLYDNFDYNFFLKLFKSNFYNGWDTAKTQHILNLKAKKIKRDNKYCINHRGVSYSMCNTG